MTPHQGSMDHEHPARDTPLDVARTTTLGFAAGLRSVMPLALLASQLEREGPDIADGGWAVEALTSPELARALAFAAVGELLADKLPFARDRVEPPWLMGRVIIGGATGALASLAEGRRSDSGAAAGSVGAVLGTLVGFGLRTRVARALPVPGLVVALAEDALAFALGRWAVSH